MQNEIERLREKFHAGRTELFGRVDWNSRPGQLLKAHASLVDEIIKEIYQISCRTADAAAVRGISSGLAIIATGGYGRRELNPYSDIDIAFIPSEEEDPWVEAVVHTAFRLVMDVFLSRRDMRIGYSFRPAAEANSWDVKTKTSLLDLRLICGDSGLAGTLARRIREGLSPLDLMLEFPFAGDRKQQSLRGLYSVEPNLKEGPGSLRDLHRARWIFKLLLMTEDDGLDQTLETRADFSKSQLAEVHEAADWLWRARSWLHLAAGKLSDVLITNYQDRIAHELNNCSAQEWLSMHLAHAETVARFREAAVRALVQGPLMVNGFLLKDGSLQQEGHLPGRVSSTGMFRVAQHYSIPINLKDLKGFEDSRKSALEIKYPSAEETRSLIHILSEEKDIAATLRCLCGYGILDRFIPDYSRIMRFVPPDPAHRYTVGEHSMQMVEHLERIRAGMDPKGHRFTDLLGECPHFDMLCLAALLHDAGKLNQNMDHCSAGGELVKDVAGRLNLPPEKLGILDFLVRQHLLLVRTSRLHDLKSPNVIQRAAEQIPGLDALRHLYIFTYIDNSAVSENNWTSMDLRDLEDLYSKIRDYITSNSDDPPGYRPQEDPSDLIRRKIAALQARNETAVLKHCDSMPAAYVLNTPLEEIAFHLQLLERLETEKVVLDIFNRPGDDYSELTVCAMDDPKPGMLAKIAGVLYACNVDILKAQAFTVEQEKRIVLDTLWVRSNGMQISESKARRIRSGLREVLTGTRPVESFVDQAGKMAPGGIEFDAIDLHNDFSEEHTVVHIVAQDLQGLLYLMTRTLSRCGFNIHSAKIATWNARAENNFYVTTTSGGQVPENELQSWTDRLARDLSSRQ